MFPSSGNGKAPACNHFNVSNAWVDVGDQIIHVLKPG